MGDTAQCSGFQVNVALQSGFPFDRYGIRWCKKLKGKKLEDQVPTVLKVWMHPNRQLKAKVRGLCEGLGYTLSISKSALSAPGSTHSWPQIVLALEWMVDVIELKNKATNPCNLPPH